MIVDTKKNFDSIIIIMLLYPHYRQTFEHVWKSICWTLVERMWLWNGMDAENVCSIKKYQANRTIDKIGFASEYRTSKLKNEWLVSQSEFES